MPESIRAEIQLPSPSILIIMLPFFHQGLVKDIHFLLVIGKWTFLMVMSETLVIAMKDLCKSLFPFFLQLPKAKYCGHTACPCFQSTPNSEAVHVQEILKFVRNDLCSVLPATLSATCGCVN